MTTAITRELTDSDLEDFPSAAPNTPSQPMSKTRQAIENLKASIAKLKDQLENELESEIEDIEIEARRRARLPHRFLVAYDQGVEIHHGDVFGWFPTKNGGRGHWVLSDEPRDNNGVTIQLGVVPYTGARYAYLFVDTVGIVSECVFKLTDFARRLREMGVPRPGDTVTHIRDHPGATCVTIIQTDDLLPGWDQPLKLFNEDDEVGELVLIDLTKTDTDLNLS